MAEATKTVEAQQVSKAKALVNERAQTMELLAQIEVNPSLFAADAAAKLEARIAAVVEELNGLPPAIRVKAMTPGQLNELVSRELEKAVKVWYPGAFAAVCKVLQVSEQAIASKDTGKHSVSIMGHYDHTNKRLVKRSKLQRLVTVSRKGVS